MSTSNRPSALEVAQAAGRADAEEFFAEHERAKSVRREAWQRRYQQQEQARRRLAERYGNEDEKRWIADPNGPSVDAVSMLYAFLHKAGPAGLRFPEIEQAPQLERADALAAAHMITVARRDARRREVHVMRQVLAHGASWDELADALETTAEELQESLRREGEQPDTWIVSTGPEDPR